MRTGSSTSTGQLVSWALAYADRGWPVLPLVPNEKRPLTKTGLFEATTDTTTIVEWWSRWPFANIGLRTGVRFDVLDIDGEVGRTSLSAKTGSEPAHSGPVSRTGRGEHWLYLPSNTANQAGLLDKLDWRGTNGYIVAPPSIHPDGHLYAWDPERGPDTDLPAVPEWLAPMLTQWVPRKTYQEKTVRVLRTSPYEKGRESQLLTFDQGLTTSVVEMAESMGFHPVADGGGRYAIECPFHDGDREPSLKLYPNTESFYCFGCGAWGDSFNLRDGRPGGARAQG